jgi:hypothetical protein
MNQAEAIRKYLLQGNRLTPKEALEKFGCFRLGARIWDIKRDYNDNVKDRFVTVGHNKKVKQYWIEQPEPVQLEIF